MKKLLIVDLAGGLGNQVFLFETAISLAAINNSIILVNKTNVDKFHSAGKSVIEDFVFPRNVKFFELNPLMNKAYLRLKQILQLLNNYKQSLSFVLHEDFSSNSFTEIEKVLLQRNPRFIIISGFWQNFAFWDRKFQFELRTESELFRNLTSDLTKKNPIIFHYRLGKINNKWEHGWGALSPRFLETALAVLSKNNVESKIVWVFSNDLTEAKKLIQPIDCSPYEVFYIDDSKILPSEVMLLFSKANFLICSNSTFSIVAAKIGAVKNVIAPLDLSKNGHKNFELPVHWKRIPSAWLQ
jgi:hypothetical protein